MRKRDITKKRIAAALLCAAMGLATAFTGGGVSQASVICMGKVSDMKASEKSEKKLLDEAAALPSKFDLRDVNGKNYVTQVKRQTPWGTCWGFSVIAACEESILYENGITNEEYEKTHGHELDLSEKALAWFANHGISDADVKKGYVPASQIGEGIDLGDAEKSDENIGFQIGGNAFFGSTVLSAAMGPKLEDYRFEGEDNEYPYAYRGKNGWTDYDVFRLGDQTGLELLYNYYYEQLRPSFSNIPDEEYPTLFKEKVFPLLEKKSLSAGSSEKQAYSVADDWSIPVDYKHRFSGNQALLQESAILPPTRKLDENGDMVYDPVGIAAIKKELVSGRAVCVGYRASQSRPGQVDKNANYLSDKWAQYTYDLLDTNHSVVIVGYDDNYSRSNFLQGTDPKTGECMTPPGDGAFIVKNSWGSINDKTEGKHNWGDFGVDGSGYFYLSYYDKSLARAESFNFYSEKEIKESNNNTLVVDQYDFMPGGALFTMYDTKPSSMANVFKTDYDQKLNRISIVTGMYNSEVTFEIYKLNKGYKNPKDGTLLEKGTRTCEYGGYHSIELKEPHPLAAGTEYSVVVTSTVDLSTDKGDRKCYEIVANEGDYFIREGKKYTMNAVVNRGESIMYRDGSWLDWSDVSAVAGNTLYTVNNKYYSIDNFSIKAFSVPASKDEVRTKNTIKLDGKSVMKACSYKVAKSKSEAGDVAFKVTRKGKGKITMKNKSAKNLKGYLMLKSGKVIVKKHAPAGKYKFTLTVAAKGNWRKTTSGVVTIVVK